MEVMDTVALATWLLSDLAEALASPSTDPVTTISFCACRVTFVVAVAAALLPSEVFVALEIAVIVPLTVMAPLFVAVRSTVALGETPLLVLSLSVALTEIVPVVIEPPFVAVSVIEPPVVVSLPTLILPLPAVIRILPVVVESVLAVFANVTLPVVPVAVRLIEPLPPARVPATSPPVALVRLSIVTELVAVYIAPVPAFDVPSISSS